MLVLAGRDPVRYTFALLPMPSHDALSRERVQPLEHDGNSVAMMNPRSMAEDIQVRWFLPCANRMYARLCTSPGMRSFT